MEKRFQWQIKRDSDKSKKAVDSNLDLLLSK